jgi:hypothetical protein
VQLPQAIPHEAAVGVGDPGAGAPGAVDAQQGLQGSAWRSCLSRARA